MSMTPAMLVVLLLLFGLPVAWFVSEFRTNARWVRCTLGVLAILCCFGVAWLTAQLTRLNYNAWYGSSAKMLIDASVENLEAGRPDLVLVELKTLQSEFQPTYENRAHFNDLVNAAVERMNKKPASKPSPPTP